MSSDSLGLLASAGRGVSRSPPAYLLVSTLLQLVQSSGHEDKRMGRSARNWKEVPSDAIVPQVCKSSSLQKDLR